MQQMFQKLGDIISYQYSNPNSLNPQCHYAFFGFQNGLAISLFSLCLSLEAKYEQFYFNFQGAANNTFVEFLKSPTRPQNSSSLYIFRDGVEVVNHHGDNPMPLMSTFKVTVAAEYAWQVTQGKIQENTWIDVETQLNLYYLPNVDTEHGKWLKLMFESGNIINGQIRLKHIPEGMISHSSNCNTEFLQALLGMDNIQAMMTNLGLPLGGSFDPYFLASSLLALQQPANVNNSSYPAYLASLNHSQVVKLANQIHEELANDPNSDLRKNDQWILSPIVLDAYTNIAMTGTAQDYTRMMRKINSRKWFDRHTQKLLEQLLGIVIMHHDFGKIHFSSAGIKGGSNNYYNMTNSVLGMVGYSTLKNGTQIQYALYLDQLSFDQWAQIFAQSNSFLAFIETNNLYLNAVAEAF